MSKLLPGLCCDLNTTQQVNLNLIFSDFLFPYEQNVAENIFRHFKISKLAD